MHCVTPMFRLFDSKNPKVGRVISRKDSMGFFEDNPNALDNQDEFFDFEFITEGWIFDFVLFQIFQNLVVPSLFVDSVFFAVGDRNFTF